MMSEPHHVMLLDCRTREHHNISADLPGCKWILINTKVKHALIDSDYNQRSAQCALSVSMIQRIFPEVLALRDVTLDMLKSSDLTDVLHRRSAFVIEENNRVHEMINALQEQHATNAGKLLKASHEGLRNKYEVSCEELDHLADFANKYPGVCGARMMGGGFGGCVICLLNEEVLDAFSKAFVASYHEQFGFDPEIILFELGGGVQQLS